jgi:hypothetical protein
MFFSRAGLHPLKTQKAGGSTGRDESGAGFVPEPASEADWFGSGR